MHKKHYIFILVFISTLPVFAQMQKDKPRSEIGFFGGASFYRGDLNLYSPFYNYLHPAGGIFFRRNFNPRFSMRFNGAYGKISAADADANSLIQKQRNLSFRSRIIEAAMLFEFNYLNFKLGSSNSYPASTYLFWGVGAFNFNPQANLGGSWVDLQPLGTEGQGTNLSSQKKYLRTQMSIPLGLGIKMMLGDKACLGIEWGMRKTFTDYLDDVSTVYVDPIQLASSHGTIAADLADRSIYVDPTLTNVGRQRGNSKNKDWYSFLGITLSFKLPQKENTCPTY